MAVLFCSLDTLHPFGFRTGLEVTVQAGDHTVGG